MRKRALVVGLLFLILFSPLSILLFQPGLIADTSATASPGHDLYLIITANTAGVSGPHPLENVIWGRVDDSGKEYGIPLIIDICEKHGVKATFFVDVYEYRVHGSEAMGEVCKYIKKRGMDVQLLTFPAQILDPVWRPKLTKETYDYPPHQWDKLWMKDYDLQEQSAILEEGKDKLKEYIGEEPIAHRAGEWGANYVTLEALRKNQILVDSSMAFGYANCDLDHPVLTHNKVAEKDGIVEVPASVFKQIQYLKVGPLTIKKSESISNLAINWNSLNELERTLAEFKRHDVRTAVLFLYSHSFVNQDENWIEFAVDNKDIEKLDQLLAWINNDPEIKVITVKEFYHLYQKDPELFQGSDHVPEIITYDSYWQSLKEAVGEAPGSIKADIFIAINVLFVLAAFVLVVYVAKRRILR